MLWSTHQRRVPAALQLVNATSVPSLGKPLSRLRCHLFLYTACVLLSRSALSPTLALSRWSPPPPTVAPQVLGEEEPSTFLTMDFFEHETQATPVVAGLTPSYDMKVQYVVKVDSFFLDYMCTHTLRIELNRATGVDFQTLGMAVVPLRKAVEDLEAGTAAGREAMSHFADVLGVSGACVRER